MVESEINKRYCQSCGMPLRFDVEEYLGTNSDGSRSDEFCYYCLKDGKYIVDISMWEMIDIWIKYTDKYNEYADTDYSPNELREILDKRLPTLNRWRQKQETSSLHHKMIQNIIVYINGHLRRYWIPTRWVRWADCPNFISEECSAPLPERISAVTYSVCAWNTLHICWSLRTIR